MEEIKQIPPWFWWVASGLITLVLSGMVGVIIFFLTRYIKSNDENWKEIKGIVNTMATTIGLLGHRTNENEKDIENLNEKLAGMGSMPFVKQKHRGG